MRKFSGLQTLMIVITSIYQIFNRLIIVISAFYGILSLHGHSMPQELYPFYK